MKVSLKRNVLHGVRVVQAGEVLDLTAEQAQEYINRGLATSVTKDAPEAEVVSEQPAQGSEAEAPTAEQAPKPKAVKPKK